MFWILILFLESKFSFSAHISPFYVQMIYNSKTWIAVLNTALDSKLKLEFKNNIWANRNLEHKAVMVTHSLAKNHPPNSKVSRSRNKKGRAITSPKKRTKEFVFFILTTRKYLKLEIYLKLEFWFQVSSISESSV